MPSNNTHSFAVTTSAQKPPLWATLLHCDLWPLLANSDELEEPQQSGVIYRAMLTLMLFAASVITVEALLYGQLGQWILYAAVLLWFALSATLLRHLLVSGVLLPPLLTLGTTLALVLAAVAANAQHHSLWLFPLLIAVAALLPARVALLLGSSALVILVLVRGDSIADFHIAQDSTLVATWLLTLTVIGILTRESEELSELALTDPLTGAFNRRYLIPQADRSMADFRRYARLSTLLMIDIDHFARVNEQFGRAIGDQVLKDLVRVIEDRIRGVDRVFRCAGEEFAVLLAETGAQSATAVAEELRRGVEGLGTIPGGKITVSIGVCDVSAISTTQDWLAKVDEALLRAQAEGRNRVVAIDSEPRPATHISSTIPIWR
jgi:diguanylate cyclase (GGDEF)-like protein